MKTLLNPYLNFSGNCREAMTFYKKCFGGELSLQLVSESPIMAAKMPPEMSNNILHSQLKSDDVVIMASDMQREAPVEGNTAQLCVNCKNEKELNSFFSSLSAGGKVVEPITDMPWGAKYGSVVDKFGKQWLFNFETKSAVI